MKILIRNGINRNIKNEDYQWIFSSNKRDKKNIDNWNYISESQPTEFRINNSFWIINNYIDNKTYDNLNNLEIHIDVSNILIGPKLIRVFEEIESEIFLDQEKNYISFNNLEIIRVPIRYWYKESNKWNPGVKFLTIWLFTLFKKKIININKAENISYLEDEYNSLPNTTKKIINEIIDIKNYVNGGNEGFIIYSDENKKLIKNIKNNIDESLSKKSEYKGLNVYYAEEEMALLNQNINFEILKSENDYLKYKYDNALTPTSSFKLSKLLKILRRQWNKKIIISDVKIENFAKIQQKNSSYSELIYSDFGKSFVKFDNNEDYERFFIGNIRDYYMFSRYYRSYKDYRGFIRDFRVLKKFDGDDLISRKIKILRELVMEDRKKIKYLCHDEINENDKLDGIEYRMCACHFNNINANDTMFFDRQNFNENNTIHDIENSKYPVCSKEVGINNSRKLRLSKGNVIKEYNLKFEKVVDSYEFK